MDFIELQTMIILIEGIYHREDRNTPEKLSELIKLEFEEDVSETEILNFYNLGEDYERITREIENGNRY